MFHSTHFDDCLPIAPGAVALEPHAVLRRLSRGDDAAVVAHLLRLGERSRRLRFGTAVNDRFVADYARAGESDRVVRTGLFLHGTLRGLAELHVDALDPVVAEGAFSIETPFRGQGHGTRLFGALLKDARASGVERLVLQCLRENVAMQRIARRHASVLSFEGSETVATLSLPAAGPAAALSFPVPA